MDSFSVDSTARIAAARNLGAKLARNDYIAFLNADCVVPGKWLEKVRESPRNGSAPMVSIFTMPAR